MAGEPQRAEHESAWHVYVVRCVDGTLYTGIATDVERRFAAGATGRTVARANCYLADQLIGALYDYVSGVLYPSHNPSEGERLAVVAVGGYGRGELAPHSDLDLLFLQPYKTTPRSEQVIEAILYFLWDLGFKVGQATRSVQDCLRQAKADMNSIWQPNETGRNLIFEVLADNGLSPDCEGCNWESES